MTLTGFGVQMGQETASSAEALTRTLDSPRLTEIKCGYRTKLSGLQGLELDQLYVDSRGTIVGYYGQLLNHLGFAATDIQTRDGAFFRDKLDPSDWEPIQTRLKSRTPGWHTIRLANRFGEWHSYRVAILPAGHWAPDDKAPTPDTFDVETTHLLLLKEAPVSRKLKDDLERIERVMKCGTFHCGPRGEHFAASKGLVALFTDRTDDFSPNLQWLMRFLSPTNQRLCLRTALAGLNRKQAFILQSWIRRTDGVHRLLTMDCEPQKNQSGTVTGLSAIVRDITDHAHLNSMCSASDAQARLIMDNATDIICWLDQSGRIAFVAPSIKKILGYEPDEVLGLNAAQFINRRDLRSVLTEISSWQDSEGHLAQPVRIQHKDRSHVWVEATVRPLGRTANGAMQGTIIVARDVGDRRRIEREREIALERAEAANAAKSRFLANMSHELRTPLNAIIGFSEIISGEMYGKLGHPKYSEHAGLIKESGYLLLELINDLLDMAKIEAGRYKLALEECDLGDILEAAVRLIRAQADEKSISLSLFRSDAPSEVLADRRAVKQIALNLLSNAVKFTPPGGHVGVTIDPMPTGVRITVSDTGIGIPKESLDRLARPFEQAHDTKTHDFKGTGLGLALVKSLAVLHGGTLVINSIEGQGTNASIDLPFTPPNAETDLI